MPRTIVEYFGRSPDFSCGYCRQDEAMRDSYGMWAHCMTPLDYQDLIDRGWRRSGKYVYKVCNETSCCPQYTIREKSLEYRMTKSQKKAMKRFNHFICLDVRPRYKVQSSAGPAHELKTPVNAPTAKNVTNIRIDSDEVSGPSSSRCTAKPSSSTSDRSEECKNSKLEEKKAKTESSKPVADSTAALPSRGKDIRRRKKLERLRKKGIDPAKNQASRKKTVEDFLAQQTSFEKPAHRFELRLLRQSDPQFASSLDTSYRVYKAYQMEIHKDPAHKCSRDTFERFLVDNPFTDDPDHGAFHWQFWLDGKLIAVSVIDILPRCVSAKYFYYLPEFGDLNLGTYSAIRELGLVRELNKRLPGVKFYYLGFYIHNCVKMRYKGRFGPCDLLCPVTMTWVPLAQCVPKLDESKYAKFQDHPKMYDFLATFDYNALGILYQRCPMTFGDYKQLNTSLEDEEIADIEGYGKIVGKKAGPRMLLFRSS